MYLDLTIRYAKSFVARLRLDFYRSPFIQDTTKEELVQFFKRFQGPVALRKRVYRFDASDGAWQFTGGVFVSFDTPENAKKFLNMFSEQNLIYNDSDGKNLDYI